MAAPCVGVTRIIGAAGTSRAADPATAGCERGPGELLACLPTPGDRSIDPGEPIAKALAGEGSAVTVSSGWSAAADVAAPRMPS
jgi:hypothetical protein